jgi:hypothetical protein
VGAVQDAQRHDARPARRQNALINAASARSVTIVVEHSGPAMMARIGILRALNRHVERVFNADRKDKHWGNERAKTRPISPEKWVPKLSARLVELGLKAKTR